MFICFAEVNLSTRSMRHSYHFRISSAALKLNKWFYSHVFRECTLYNSSQTKVCAVVWVALLFVLLLRCGFLKLFFFLCFLYKCDDEWYATMNRSYIWEAKKFEFQKGSINNLGTQFYNQFRRNLFDGW